MADNSLRTPGSGETIRTIDKSSVKTGVTVLDIGGSSTESLVTTSNPVPVESRPTGIKVVDFSPTVQASPDYSVDDRVGGTVTVASCGRANGGTGTIVGAVLIDAAKQLGDLELWIWNAAPTGGSDNAAFTANLDSTFQGVISFSTWFAESTKAAAHPTAGEIPFVFKCGAADTSLYARFVTRSTLNFAATTDLKCYIQLVQD